jgi:hypothetical protein
MSLRAGARGRGRVKSPTATDYPARELAACDAGIICVDTPMGDGGACDTTHVHDAIERLPLSTVLIRSTIPPGTADLLASTTGKHVCFSPEYVGESTYHPLWPDGDRDVRCPESGGHVSNLTQEPYSRRSHQSPWH